MIKIEEILNNKIEYNSTENKNDYTYLIFLIKNDKIVFVTYSQKGEQHLTTMKNKEFDSYYIKKIFIKEFAKYDIFLYGDIIALYCFKFQPVYNKILRFSNTFACKENITKIIKEYDLRDVIPSITTFKKLANKYKLHLWYLHGSIYVNEFYLMDLLDILDKIKKDNIRNML